MPNYSFKAHDSVTSTEQVGSAVLACRAVRFDARRSGLAGASLPVGDQLQPRHRMEAAHQQAPANAAVDAPRTTTSAKIDFANMI
jgi:hypothetical protein